MDMNINIYRPKAFEVFAEATKATRTQLKSLEQREQNIINAALGCIVKQNDELFNYSEREIQTLTDKLRQKISDQNPARENPRVLSHTKALWNFIKDSLGLHHVGFRIGTDNLSDRITQTATTLDRMKERLEQLKQEIPEKQKLHKNLQPQLNVVKFHQVLKSITSGGLPRENDWPGGLPRELAHVQGELQNLFTLSMGEEELGAIQQKANLILTTFRSQFQEAAMAKSEEPELRNEIKNLQKEQVHLEKLLAFTKIKEELSEVSKNREHIQKGVGGTETIQKEGISEIVDAVKQLKGKSFSSEDAIKIARKMTLEGRVITILSDEEALAIANKIVDLKSLIGKTLTEENVVFLANAIKNQLIKLKAIGMKANEEAGAATLSKFIEFNIARGKESMNSNLEKQLRMNFTDERGVAHKRTQAEALEYSLSLHQKTMDEFCSSVDLKLRQAHPDLFADNRPSKIDIATLEIPLQQIYEAADRIVTNPAILARAEQTSAEKTLKRFSLEFFEGQMDKIKSDLTNGSLVREEAVQKAKKVKDEFQSHFARAVEHYEKAKDKAIHLTVEENRKRNNNSSVEPQRGYQADPSKIKEAAAKKIYEMNVKINQAVQEKYGDLLEIEILVKPLVKDTQAPFSTQAPKILTEMPPLTTAVARRMELLNQDLAKIQLKGEGSYGDKIKVLKTQAQALYETALKDFQKLVDKGEADPSHADLLNGVLNKYYKGSNIQTPLKNALESAVTDPFKDISPSQLNTRFRELRNLISIYIAESKPFLPSLTLSKLKADALRQLITELKKAGGAVSSSEQRELIRTEELLKKLDSEMEILNTVPQKKMKEFIRAANELSKMGGYYFDSAIEKIKRELAEGKIDLQGAQVQANQIKNKFLKEFAENNRIVHEAPIEGAEVAVRYAKATDQPPPKQLLEVLKGKERASKKLETEMANFTKEIEERSKKYPDLFK